MYSFYLKLLAIFAIFVTSVSGDCTLRIFNQSPIFIKNFGTRKIMLKNQPQIQLMEGENISANCPVNLDLRSDYYNDLIIPESNNVKSVELRCLNNRFTYKLPDELDFNDIRGNNEVTISCNANQNSILYESLTPLPDCAPYTTYGVGFAPTNTPQVIKAAFCYDLEKLQLKFANFVAYRPQYEFIGNQPAMRNTRTVGLDIKLINWDSYFAFMSEEQFKKALLEQQRPDSLLYLHEFDFESLIQDVPLIQDLQNLKKMLNTVWWRNLRLGNWQYFLAALKERSKTVTYNVYTGTSGQMALPTSSCNKTNFLSMQHDEVSVNAPEYVWYYINSITPNVTEELVVIGYNSPFYNKADDIVLCKDTCDDIDWLKTSTFAKVRAMPTMGLMFCCHPDEVADKLKPFPLEKKQAKQVSIDIKVPFPKLKRRKLTDYSNTVPVPMYGTEDESEETNEY